MGKRATSQDSGTPDQTAELRDAIALAEETGGGSKAGEAKIAGLRDVLGDEKVNELLEEYRANQSAEDQRLETARDAVSSIETIDNSITDLRASLGERADSAVEALESEKADLLETAWQSLRSEGEPAAEPTDRGEAAPPVPEPKDQPPEPEPKPETEPGSDQPAGLTVEHIKRAASIIYETSPEQLASSDKPKALAKARNTVSHLAAEQCQDVSWNDIGKALGRSGSNLKYAVETGSNDSPSFRDRLAEDASLARRTSQVLRIAKAFEAMDSNPAVEDFAGQYIYSVDQIDYDPTGGNPHRKEAVAIDEFGRVMDSLIPLQATDPSVNQERFASLRELAITNCLTNLRYVTKASRHHENETHTQRQFFELADGEQSLIQQRIMLAVAGERLGNRLYTSTNQVLGYAMIDAAFRLDGQAPAFDIMEPAELEEPEGPPSDQNLPEDEEAAVIPLSKEELAGASDLELVEFAREGREEAISELTLRYRDLVDDLLISDQYETAFERNENLLDIAHGELAKAFIKFDPQRSESFEEQTLYHVRKAMDTFVAEHISSSEAKSEFADAYFSALLDRFARYGQKRNIVSGDDLGVIEQAKAIARSAVTIQPVEAGNAELAEAASNLSGNAQKALASRTAERLALLLRSAIRNPIKPVDESFGQLEEEVQKEIVYKVACRVAEEMALDASIEGPSENHEARLVRRAKDRTAKDFVPGDAVRCPPYIYPKRGSHGELSQAVIISSNRSDTSHKSDYVQLEITKPDGETVRDRMDVTDDLLLHEKCYEMLPHSRAVRKHWRSVANKLSKGGSWPPKVPRKSKRRRSS